MIKRLFIILLLGPNLLWALNANLDGQDCIVDFGDFAVFAGQWMLEGEAITNTQADYNSDGVVNHNDLIILADQWLLIDPNNPCPWTLNQLPTAEDMNVSTFEYYREPITLTGDDDGYQGAVLTYILTSLPQDGYLLDPDESAGIIKANALPYWIANKGKTLIYVGDTAGAYNFNYKVNDGQSDSNEATVTLQVYENPADSINYDGQTQQSGYVKITHVPEMGFDANWVAIELDYGKFDLIDGRGIMFFIKTRNPDCWVMRKRSPGNSGYEILLIDGKPTVKLYGNSGTVASCNHSARVDNGQWNLITVLYKNNPDPNTDMTIGVHKWGNDGTSWNENADEYFWNLPDINYANSDDVYISTQMGGIDRVKIYSGGDPANMNLGWAAAGLEGRNDVGVGAFATSPVVRFMFNGAMTDEVAGLTAEINDTNKVNFVPPVLDTRGVIESPDDLGKSGTRDGYFTNFNGEKISPQNNYRRNRL